MNNKKIRDGFEFTAIKYPFNLYDAIKITEEHEIEEYIKYINKHSIEYAEIVMPNLEVLKYCPQLKYLNIRPSYNALQDFDFSPLYTLPEVYMLNCINEYGPQCQYVVPIDYSRINGLKELSFSVNTGTLNYHKIMNLKSLSVGDFKGSKGDLTDLFCSAELDTLELRGCRISSLDGIEKSKKIQCLYISYNQSLKDISALGKVKRTLKALRIENCSKIEDFSVLEELENLELLELTGKNQLESLKFIKKMRRLKTFVFNMNILDGDLTPCLGLSYACSEKNRSHYNLKDKDLPKGEYVRGNEDIELWRRLE